MKLPLLRGLCTTAGRLLATAVFIINVFSIYLSIIFYLSIREGDLSHSGVIAGNLEKRHKGESSLGDLHYETVPKEPPAVPSPRMGHHVPIPLRWDTAQMHPGAATAEIHL